MLKLNYIVVKIISVNINNLNTSYVEVKLMNNVTEGGATVNLNTSYVEVKL